LVAGVPSTTYGREQETDVGSRNRQAG